MDSISFQPVIPFAALVALLVIAGALLWIQPSFASLTPSRRLTLSLLRLSTILMVAVAMVRPGCVQETERNQSAVLMMLLDATRSMEHPHLSDDSTRWQAAKQMLNQNQGRIEQLKQSKIDVRTILFDNQSRNVEWTETGFDLPSEPAGSETDIGTAIYDASLAARDQRLLGLVLATDGVQNVLDPEVELTRATEVLRDLEVPLYGIPFGLPGDAGQLADVAVTNVAEQHIVNVKNDLSVRATVVSRGYPNQDITVELLLIDSNGEQERVQTEIIRPASSYSETNVELKYRPTEPGEYRIKVRAVPMPGEVAIRNNDLDAFLTVNDKGMRVLYLVGDLGFEQRFLRKALSINEFIQLDFVPIFANTRGQWPVQELEGYFSDPTYDVFILGDLDSRAIFDSRTHTQSMQALHDAVLGGKGLLMLGGAHSFGAGLYQKTPLKDVLPVKMDATEKQDFGKPIRRDLHINDPIKLVPTKDHYLTRLDAPDGVGNVWKELPPLPGANRFAGVKDNAEVLLTSEEGKHPIMVTANVGGRVVAFAGDQTWKWKMRDFGEQYDQFWRQVILWLAFWDARTDESVSIELPQRRFSSGAKFDFNVSVKAVASEAENTGPPEVEARLIKPDGSSELLSLGRAGDRFQGTVVSESLVAPGLYRLEAAAARNGQPIGTSQREFVVMDRDREKSNPAANPDQLVSLANETREFGGRTIEPAQLGDLLDELIANPPTTKVSIPTTWRLAEEFPSAATFLGVFVALLMTEWWLRKKWGMV